MWSVFSPPLSPLPPPLSAVQQTSYYGLSSMLPKKYSQAVMAGESIAGVVVSINRIITKAAIENEETSSITFFVISFVFILVCVGCFCFIRTSPFVKHHTTQCSKIADGGNEKKGVAGEIPLLVQGSEEVANSSDQDDSKELLPDAHHESTTRLQKFYGDLSKTCITAFLVRLRPDHCIPWWLL